MNKLQTIPPSQRQLVTTHDAFQYYANAYGLEVAGTLIGISTEEQPSAQTVKNLAEEIKKTKVPAIFAETTINPKLITTVAEEAGVKLAPQELYSDSIGAPGSEGDSYLKMLIANTESIVESLGGNYEPYSSNQIVTVTEAGFGNAKLCQTPEELQQALPDLVVGSRKEQGALVDSTSVEVTDADGNLEFHALFSSDGTQLNLFMTDNPRYQTTAGVGPGTSIEMAVSQYGPASLSYSTEVESREFVSFENKPTGISFHTGSGPEAGIYAPNQSVYYQTKEYKPDAKIRWIWVSNRTECSDSK